MGGGGSENGNFPLGVVHILCLQDEVGRWSKMSTFCQRLYHRKCQRREGRWFKKAPKHPDVIYRCSLSQTIVKRGIIVDFATITTFWDVVGSIGLLLCISAVSSVMDFFDGGS